MSKERQRAREARELARAAEVKAAAERRAKAAKRADLRSKLTPAVPRRKSRYGALSNRELGQLAAAFVGLQAIAYPFVSGFEARAGVAVLSLAVLLVLTATRRSSTR